MNKRKYINRKDAIGLERAVLFIKWFFDNGYKTVANQATLLVYEDRLNDLKKKRN